MAVRLSELCTGCCFTPQKHYFYASGTHFCKSLSKPQGLVRPEGLGKLINIIHLIGSRTRDLPVCNIIINLLFNEHVMVSPIDNVLITVGT
jgi:hypothetical protein